MFKIYLGDNQNTKMTCGYTRWDHFLKASQKCGAFFIWLNHYKTII